jgi:prepilin-type N-terminal cleavage/methylation domain-containing protein
MLHVVRYTIFMKAWAARQTDKGFTIVELLIVIVVIAVLAAITIVAYNGVQNRTNDTAVMSDLRNLATRAGEFNAINGRYPQNYNDMISIPVKVTKSAYDLNSTTGFNIAFCSASASAYAITALSKSGKKFSIGSGDSLKEFPSNTVNDGLSSGGSCSDILAGSSRVTTGYVSSDTTTGPWRAWAGGN